MNAQWQRWRRGGWGRGQRAISLTGTQSPPPEMRIPKFGEEDPYRGSKDQTKQIKGFPSPGSLLSLTSDLSCSEKWNIPI